jgi:diaminohydroxyphosphoribosylaminopyrimidine deaminase/5-amino-6-(5-phosphoribosylamino)uracil reductase
LSGSGILNKDLAINETNGTVIVFTYNTEADFGKAGKVILSEKANPAMQIIEYLYKSGIQSVLIEGGAKVLNHFIAQGLWDEAKIFRGNTYFNDGIKAPGIKGKHFSSFDFESSKLEILINNGSNIKL